MDQIGLDRGPAPRAAGCPEDAGTDYGCSASTTLLTHRGSHDRSRRFSWPPSWFVRPESLQEFQVGQLVTCAQSSQLVQSASSPRYNPPHPHDLHGTTDTTGTSGRGGRVVSIVACPVVTDVPEVPLTPIVRGRTLRVLRVLLALQSVVTTACHFVYRVSAVGAVLLAAEPGEPHLTRADNPDVRGTRSTTTITLRE